MDSDYKSSQAYQLLKEIQRETLANIEGDIESLTSLAASKDVFLGVLSGYQPGMGATVLPQKADKLTKAQDVVEHAKKLMGDNVKKMIDNQKDFNVSPSFNVYFYRTWYRSHQTSRTQHSP